MNEFRFLLVWIAIFALLQQNMVFTEPLEEHGTIQKRWRLVWAFVLFFPIFHLAAFGPVIGDTGAYISIYEALPDTWQELWKRVLETASGRGFIFFEALIKIVFGNNIVAFRVFLATAHSIPIILLYRKYSKDYLISVFLFVATCCHISWMMNGLRQFLAAVIIYAATTFTIRKKYLLSTIMVLLASTIHSSAIIMLPVVFIATGSAWNKRTMLFIIVAVISAFAFSRNNELMDSLLIGTEYEGAVEYWTALGDDGASPFRVLVSSVPVILALIERESLNLKKDAVMNFLVNMSIVNLGLYLIAMVTSGIMIGRLPGYTGLYNHILLPNILHTSFRKENRRVITIWMVLFYLIYFWYGRGFR